MGYTDHPRWNIYILNTIIPHVEHHKIMWKAHQIFNSGRGYINNAKGLLELQIHCGLPLMSSVGLMP